MREDEEIAEIAEEATAAAAAAGADALYAIPQMREDERRAEEAAAAAEQGVLPSDESDIDIGPTFFYDEYTFAITECGNDAVN